MHGGVLTHPPTTCRVGTSRKASTASSGRSTKNVFEDMYVVSAEQVLEEHHMAALKEQLSKQLEEEKALHREHARAQHKRLAADSDDSDVLE